MKASGVPDSDPELHNVRMILQQIQARTEMVKKQQADRQKLAMQQQQLAMQQQQQLKSEIEAVIAEFATGDQRNSPPYTVSELVVMAAICGLEERITEKKVLKWTLRTFPYYTDRAIDHYLEIGTGQARQPSLTPGQLSRASQAIRMFSVKVDMPFTSVYEVVGREVKIKEYIVHCNQARAFLQNRLEPAREKTFAFLDLPLELRTTIYEMVLVFDSRGFEPYL